MSGLKPIQRVTTEAFADSERRGEALLHKLLAELEAPPDRLGLLIVAWNRCTEAERAQFLALLRCLG